MKKSALDKRWLIVGLAMARVAGKTGNEENIRNELSVGMARLGEEPLSDGEYYFFDKYLNELIDVMEKMELASIQKYND